MSLTPETEDELIGTLTRIADAQEERNGLIRKHDKGAQVILYIIIGGVIAFVFFLIGLAAAY